MLRTKGLHCSLMAIYIHAIIILVYPMLFCLNYVLHEMFDFLQKKSINHITRWQFATSSEVKFLFCQNELFRLHRICSCSMHATFDWDSKNARPNWFWCIFIKSGHYQHEEKTITIVLKYTYIFTTTLSEFFNNLIIRYFWRYFGEQYISFKSSSSSPREISKNKIGFCALSLPISGKTQEILEGSISYSSVIV